MGKIIKKAVSLFDKVTELYDNELVGRIYFGAILVGSQILTVDYAGNYFYHASGALTCLIAAGIDSTATIPCIKLTNTAEFKMYGLDKRFGEANPIYGKHPTMKKYVSRTILKDLFFAALSFIIPPVGYAYLLSMPMIYRNNTKNAKEMENLISHYKTREKYNAQAQ